MKTIYKNSAPPPGAVYFNYRTSKESLPDAGSLPTLVKPEAMKAILGNEENPLYRVEAVDFPVKGAGGTYTGEFFESFLDRMKTHPFGGNKLGHSYPEKNDFYTVGGRIEKNGGGGTGTVYFKIIIPSMGYETTNSGFIRDVLAGNVHFSLVTQPEYEIRKNEKTGEMETFFIKSAGCERNDAVPFERGAMKQEVNSKDYDYEQARSLIGNGQIDYKTKSESGEIIQNGQVTYSVLRHLSRSSNSRTPGLAELLSLADKQRNRRKTMGDEDKVITKEDAVRALAGLYANGLVTVAEVAKGIGSTAPSFLRNEQDEENGKLANSVRERLGGDPLAELDRLLNTKAENEKFLVQNAVRSQAGPEKIKNAKGEEADNPAYDYAMKVCNGKAGQELKNALEALKTDSVMLTLLGNQADHTTEFNRIEGGGSHNSKAAAPAVMEV
ncbi:MAG: hypothetical protein LBH43_12025 [Treponema sp.]|jgi:hypothetical protein|nr:hypothetical protein [Treponema sp.]